MLFAEKSVCAECKVERVPKRGILAVNCINESLSEWFCGFPCLLDFFGKIEGIGVSETTKLLDKFGITPANSIQPGDE